MRISGFITWTGLECHVLAWHKWFLMPFKAIYGSDITSLMTGPGSAVAVAAVAGHILHTTLLL